LCLVAEPRCKVDDAPISSVFATMLKADLAKGCVARSNPNSEPENVTLASPLSCQALYPIPHVKREPNGTLGMIGTRDRIVEEYHDSVRKHPFQRPFISKDKLSHALVIFTQHRHDLFRLGRLSEGAESPQIAEHRCHFPPVALQKRVGRIHGSNHLRHLRRQKSL